jgi:hypothetical protein
MAGREVFKHAVRSMAEAADQALLRAGLTSDDIDLLMPHQANMRIIEATARYANMPMDKVFVNVDRYGNMSSATLPIALDEAIEQGRQAPGDEHHDGGVRRRLHLGVIGDPLVALLFPGPGLAVRRHGARPRRRVRDGTPDLRGGRRGARLRALARNVGRAGRELTATSNAQPAILVHSIAALPPGARAARRAVGLAAGHSLGEFSAYVAAGSLGFADGVRIVRRRGELMLEQPAGKRPGAMAALLGAR